MNPISTESLTAHASIVSTWLEEGSTITEPERARIHALTRKVTMSDEEVLALLRAYMPKVWMDWPEAELAMRDLRDRYKERGKYAPLPASDTTDAKPRE